jgi:hypothetical protein
MKLCNKPLTDFQLTEQELIEERRFGLIALMCNKILRLQQKCERDLFVDLDDLKTKNGMISFNVWERDRKVGINKNTLELAVLHINKHNKPDGLIFKGRVKKFKDAKR